MPAVAEAPQTSTFIERKRWTRDECDVLEAAGIHDLDRYELIEGELIRKASKNIQHSLVLILLSEWLRSVFGVLSVLQEGSVDMPAEDFATSIPEPDLIVLRRSVTEIPRRASASDLLLAVEVAVSTLSFDRSTKAALYARAGIIEYWIVDVVGRRLIVHREPRDGAYQSVLTYSEDESISPIAAPTPTLLVRHCFEPAS